MVIQWNTEQLVGRVSWMLTYLVRVREVSDLNLYLLAIYLSLSSIYSKISSDKIVVAHLDGKSYVLQMH